MIEKCENFKGNGKIRFKSARKKKKRSKNACQNTVAVETSNCLDHDMSY